MEKKDQQGRINLTMRKLNKADVEENTESNENIEDTSNTNIVDSVEEIREENIEE